jgi:hypothetical protein
MPCPGRWRRSQCCFTGRRLLQRTVGQRSFSADVGVGAHRIKSPCEVEGGSCGLLTLPQLELPHITRTSPAKGDTGPQRVWAFSDRGWDGRPGAAGSSARRGRPTKLEGESAGPALSTLTVRYHHPGAEHHGRGSRATVTEANVERKKPAPAVGRIRYQIEDGVSGLDDRHLEQYSDLQATGLSLSRRDTGAGPVRRDRPGTWFRNVTAGSGSGGPGGSYPR